MKILFFHGSGGGSIIRFNKYFINRGIELSSPEISYYDFIDNEHLFPLLNKLAENTDVIVGHSMGGWFAYHLAVKNNKELILFNPAISNITQSNKCFKSITPDVTDIKLEKQITVYLSDIDNVVNHDYTRKTLSKTKCDNITIHSLGDEEHNIKPEIMLSEMFKYCQDFQTRQLQEGEEIN